MIKKIIKNDLFMSSFITKSEVLQFFNVLINLDATREILIEFGTQVDTNLTASNRVIVAMSESEEIRQIILDYKLKFDVTGGHEYAAIFDNSAKTLKVILPRAPYGLCRVLITEQQIRNYEEFSGYGIAEVFLDHINKRSDGLSFITYSMDLIVLDYWNCVLNNPIFKEIDRGSWTRR